MKTILKYLDNQRSSLICLISMLIAVAVSSIGIYTGFILNLSAYLVIPVVIAGWYGSKRAGFILAFFSSVAWIMATYFSRTESHYKTDDLYAGLLNLVAYILVAILISRFRGFHREEKLAADTDKLTGVLNHRGFYTEFANEIIRSIRYGHIFSLAYIDIDDFKLINDRFGHSFGDEVLTKTANSLRTTLRSVDVVSRLGGDEFVCLLPETDAEAAKAAFLKVNRILSEIEWDRGLVVRYSMGLVTFKSPPEDARQALTIADDLMYSVKKNKKDDIAISVWDGKHDLSDS